MYYIWGMQVHNILTRYTHVRVWIKGWDCRGRNGTKESRDGEVDGTREKGRRRGGVEGAWGRTRTKRKEKKSRDSARISRKEKMNVINTMHHIPATSWRTVSEAFYCPWDESWRNTGSWRLLAAHFTLIKLRCILSRERRCLTVGLCLESFHFCLHVARFRRSINICNPYVTRGWEGLEGFRAQPFFTTFIVYK